MNNYYSANVDDGVVSAITPQQRRCNLSSSSINSGALSNKELQAIRRAATEELKKRAAEKQRIENLRKNYALRTPQREYRKHHTLMWVSLCEHIEKYGVAGAEDIKRIEARHTDRIPHKGNDIYPCPQCARMSLERGVWGADNKLSYAAICRSCGWAAPVSRYDDVWSELHEWLIKHNYLEAGTDFPR